MYTHICIRVCQISLSLCLNAGPHDAANIRWYQLYTQFCDRGVCNERFGDCCCAHCSYKLFVPEHQSDTVWLVYIVYLSVYHISLYISQTLWCIIWYTSESIYIHSTCHHILRRQDVQCLSEYYIIVISLIVYMKHLLVRHSVYLVGYLNIT